MSEYAAIQNLITRYTLAVNRKDYDAIADVFAPDATWDAVGRVQLSYKGAEIAESIKETLERLKDLFQMNCAAQIEIDGDRATAQSAMYEFGAVDDRIHFGQTGIYEDVLIKVGGEWKFASRRFVCFYRSPPRVVES